MPTHWTYADLQESSDLQQGDILSPSLELRSVFNEVHPHFSDNKYLAFMIITQSCDLVRRDGECSAKYINVAVVRSLSQVLPSLIETVCPSLSSLVYSEDHRNRVCDLMARIFNQNEQKHGLFYLYPDGDIGIGEGAVAFLRVSVAFRHQHYELMRKSRSGRLQEPFAHKLGWLVGNLYSRVGTQDWDKKQLKDLVDEYIGDGNDLGIRWIDRYIARQLEKEIERDAALTREEVLDRASKGIKRPKDLGIDRIVAMIKSEFPEMDAEALARLRTTLHNDSELSTVFR